MEALPNPWTAAAIYPRLLALRKARITYGRIEAARWPRMSAHRLISGATPLRIDHLPFLALAGGCDLVEFLDPRVHTEDLSELPYQLGAGEADAVRAYLDLWRSPAGRRMVSPPTNRMNGGLLEMEPVRLAVELDLWTRRTLRERAGVGAPALAKALGYASHASLVRLERGALRELQLERAGALLVALGQDPLAWLARWR